MSENPRKDENEKREQAKPETDPANPDQFSTDQNRSDKDDRLNKDGTPAD